MRQKYIKSSFLFFGICLTTIVQSNAAVVFLPDLVAGGDFTIAVGDIADNTAATYSFGETGSSTITVNGTWDAAEIQVGGLRGDMGVAEGQDATLQIGSTGVVNATAMWFADGFGAIEGEDGGSAINIDAGGTLTFTGESFGIRSWGGFAANERTFDGVGPNGTPDGLGVLELLWNEELLTRDGVTNVGSFEDNFFITEVSGTEFSITAIPEPSSTALLGLGGIALLLRRKK